MDELVGENYGDDHSGEEPPEQEQEQQGTQPGEGRLDKPSTTGTHRGWGDPQPGEED